MSCKSCGDRCGASEYCTFCDKLYFKNASVRERETKRTPKVKKKIEYDERVCEDCNLSFKPKGRIQKKCTECNRKWKDRTPGEKWLAKKPHKNVMNSNQVAYGFFRKKYGVPNNVFRG